MEERDAVIAALLKGAGFNIDYDAAEDRPDPPVSDQEEKPRVLALLKALSKLQLVRTQTVVIPEFSNAGSRIVAPIRGLSPNDALETLAAKLFDSTGVCKLCKHPEDEAWETHAKKHISEVVTFGNLDDVISRSAGRPIRDRGEEFVKTLKGEFWERAGVLYPAGVFYSNGELEDPSAAHLCFYDEGEGHLKCRLCPVPSATPRGLKELAEACETLSWKGEGKVSVAHRKHHMAGAHPALFLRQLRHLFPPSEPPPEWYEIRPPEETSMTVFANVAVGNYNRPYSSKTLIRRWDPDSETRERVHELMRAYEARERKLIKRASGFEPDDGSSAELDWHPGTLVRAIELHPVVKTETGLPPAISEPPIVPTRAPLPLVAPKKRKSRDTGRKVSKKSRGGLPADSELESTALLLERFLEPGLFMPMTSVDFPRDEWPRRQLSPKMPYGTPIRMRDGVTIVRYPTQPFSFRMAKTMLIKFIKLQQVSHYGPFHPVVGVSFYRLSGSTMLDVLMEQAPASADPTYSPSEVVEAMASGTLPWWSSPKTPIEAREALARLIMPQVCLAVKFGCVSNLQAAWKDSSVRLDKWGLSITASSTAPGTGVDLIRRVIVGLLGPENEYSAFLRRARRVLNQVEVGCADPGPPSEDVALMLEAYGLTSRSELPEYLLTDKLKLEPRMALSERFAEAIRSPGVWIAEDPQGTRLPWLIIHGSRLNLRDDGHVVFPNADAVFKVLARSESGGASDEPWELVPATMPPPELPPPTPVPVPAAAVGPTPTIRLMNELESLIVLEGGNAGGSNLFDELFGTAAEAVPVITAAGTEIPIDYDPIAMLMHTLPEASAEELVRGLGLGEAENVLEIVPHEGASATIVQQKRPPPNPRPPRGGLKKGGKRAKVNHKITKKEIIVVEDLDLIPVNGNGYSSPYRTIMGKGLTPLPPSATGEFVTVPSRQLDEWVVWPAFSDRSSSAMTAALTHRRRIEDSRHERPGGRACRFAPLANPPSLPPLMAFVADNCQLSFRPVPGELSLPSQVTFTNTKHSATIAMYAGDQGVTPVPFVAMTEQTEIIKFTPNMMVRADTFYKTSVQNDTDFTNATASVFGKCMEVPDSKHLPYIFFSQLFARVVALKNRVFSITSDMGVPLTSRWECRGDQLLKAILRGLWAIHSVGLYVGFIHPKHLWLKKTFNHALGTAKNDIVFDFVTQTLENRFLLRNTYLPRASGLNTPPEWPPKLDYVPESLSGEATDVFAAGEVIKFFLAAGGDPNFDLSSLLSMTSSPDPGQRKSVMEIATAFGILLAPVPQERPRILTQEMLPVKIEYNRQPTQSSTFLVRVSVRSQ